MALTKMLFGAWAVSAGASECVNATLLQMPVGQAGEGCFPTDVAVDSSGNVWISTTCSMWKCPSNGYECYTVYSDSALSADGIAVDDTRNGTTVYISQNTDHGKGLMKCTLPDVGSLDCFSFGENWDELHGLDLDHEGNLLVTNAQGHAPSDAPPGLKAHGVWRCSPEADCVLVGGSGNHWPDERGVAGDSIGNVYMSGKNRGFLEKCTSAGTCKEFGAQMGAIGQGVAVGPDDYVYMTNADMHSFTRCSPDDVCEMFAPDGFPDGPIAIDHNGVVYRITRTGSMGFDQFTLIKSCFYSPSALLV